MIMMRLALLGGAIAIVGGCSNQRSNDANSTATAVNSVASKPPAAATRVRGVVQTVSADSLALTTYDGRSVTVPLDANTKFAWVTGSSLATLKSGDFVGTATTGPDDALRAAELVIFPESMRGTGEGHYDWDVPGVVAAAGGSASTSSAMTNGTVRQQNAMTNGTVTGGVGKPGETRLTIGYKGGSAQVRVPAGTPIVRFEPTTRSVLAKGQKVFVVQTAGALGAKFVAIGKDGLTPPM